MTKKSLPALQLLAGLVCPDGELWGQRATKWQWDDARAVLADSGPRRFLYTAPRGDGKTENTAGQCLVWGACLSTPGARGYAFAASEAQASRFMEALRGFVLRTPTLQNAVRVQQSKVIFANDASFEVMSSDATSAWGLRPDFLVVDELAQWKETSGPRELWTAITSAVPKVPGCKLKVITSAGSPSHFAWEVRQHALKSRQWRVTEIPGPLPWRTEDDLEEERATRLPSDYAHLVLNVWADVEDRLALRADVEAAATLSATTPLPHNPAYRYVTAVDLGISHDRTVVVTAHAEMQPVEAAVGESGLLPRWVQRGARIVVDRMDVWKPDKQNRVIIEEVGDVVEHVARKYDSYVVADPYQSVDVIQRLQARGIRALHHTFSPTSNGRIASTLHELLRNGRIDIPNWPDLVDEICNVRLRETSPGVVRLDHVAGRHDDMAVTIAMAAYYLLHVEMPDARSETLVYPQVPVTQVEGFARKLAAFGDETASGIVRRIDEQRRPIPVNEYIARVRRRGIYR